MGKSIHSFELKNGARIPSVGLGTWRAALSVVDDAVTTAVKVGWRLKIEVLKNPILKMIAEKLGKSPAQVALWWGLQMGHSVLPKSINKARIIENIGIFYWSIPKDLFSKLSEIEQESDKERLVTGTTFVHGTYGASRTLDELWDGEMREDFRCKKSGFSILATCLSHYSIFKCLASS
ncbi:hypothetical protein Peur_063907 [Populus x canadensis]